MNQMVHSPKFLRHYVFMDWLDWTFCDMDGGSVSHAHLHVCKALGS